MTCKGVGGDFKRQLCSQVRGIIFSQVNGGKSNCVKLAQIWGARTSLGVSENSIEMKLRTLPYEIGYYYFVIFQNQK